MNAILTWLLSAVLNWLFVRISAELATASAQLAEDKRRGQVNSANLKRYQEAKTRGDRISAALSLLNGDAAP